MAKTRTGVWVAVGSLLAGLAIWTAAAHTAQPDHVAMARRLAAEFVVPRYQALSEAAEAQAGAWDALCTAPSATSLDNAKKAYRAAADAWSAVELVRYGPVSEEFRAERLSYWPERKNATGRGLAALLGRRGEEDLTSERMRGASAAVQGLPALERLLFADPSPLPESFGETEESLRRCAVGRAIAGNVASLAREIVEGWQRLVTSFADPAVAGEATRRLATDLATSVEVLRDVKARPVLGADVRRARPRLAEGWRSERPTRALLLNLEAAEALAAIMLEGAAEEATSALYNIRQASRIAEGLPADFGPLAADPQERHRVVLLLDALGFARDRVLADVPRALGIAMGFNSLDGD